MHFSEAKNSIYLILAFVLIGVGVSFYVIFGQRESYTSIAIESKEVKLLTNVSKKILSKRGVISGNYSSPCIKYFGSLDNFFARHSKYFGENPISEDYEFILFENEICAYQIKHFYDLYGMLDNYDGYYHYLIVDYDGEFFEHDVWCLKSKNWMIKKEKLNESVYYAIFRVQI